MGIAAVFWLVQHMKNRLVENPHTLALLSILLSTNQKTAAIPISQKPFA